MPQLAVVIVPEFVSKYCPMISVQPHFLLACQCRVHTANPCFGGLFQDEELPSKLPAYHTLSINVDLNSKKILRVNSVPRKKDYC